MDNKQYKLNPINDIKTDFDTFLSTVTSHGTPTICWLSLIDYLIPLMSTESCPSLNGIVGNHERLTDELLEMGIFDSRLSTDFINKCQASIILENAPPETVVQLLRIALTILNHEHNCD